jgi:hypothetical protein
MSSEGTELSRESTTSSETENAAPARIVAGIITITTMQIPYTFDGTGTPLIFENFTEYLGELMTTTNADNKFNKDDTTATVEKILRFPSVNDDTAATARVPAPRGTETDVLRAILSKMTELARSLRMTEGEDLPLLTASQILDTAYRELPIEVKYLETGDVETLSARAADKVIARLSNRVRSAFDFCSLGVDCTATGAVVSLVHVEVVQLSLVGMGTPSAEVIPRSTGKLPLFSKAVVEKLLGPKTELNEKYQEKRNTFLSELFPYGIETGPIPAGMDVLFRILLCNPSDLSTPYWQEHALYQTTTTADGPRIDYVLENRLGAGAFGAVFSVTGFSNIVVKASQGSGSYDWKITNEIKVLTAFNSGISKCVNIPQLQNTGILAVSIGGCRVDLKAFVSSPRGLPIDHLCTQLHDTIEQKILLVAEGVRAALDFAHRISWFYLDVRPSNIVFELEGQKVKRAILIEL